MKPETKFQQEFGLSLRRIYPKGFWHNIRDIPYKTPKGFVANTKKPFDAMFIAPDFRLAIEFKRHGSHRAWPNSLKDHQRKGLEAARSAGMLPLVTIQVKFDKVNFAASLDPQDVQGKSMRPEALLEQARFVHYRRKVHLGDHSETLYDVTQFGECYDARLLHV